MKPHSISALVRGYIAHRRKMGFGFQGAATQLLNFGRYADRVAPGKPLTNAVAMEWAALPGDNRRGYHGKRLKLVRGFASYCAALDPRTEVPPPGVFGPSSLRSAPHIYSEAEVQLLMDRARRLPCGHASCALRPHTHEAIIGLLHSTGLRRAELLRLRLRDFDPNAGTLLVPAVKTSPQRLLPLHPSVVAALQRYLELRARLVPFGDHLFVGPQGRPIPATTLNKTFRLLCRGISGNGDRPGPRLVDFRHSFATRLIAEWARDPQPRPHRLLLLSRYMGHKQFNQTWWYVTPDCTALQAAAARFQTYQDSHLKPL
ncbi:MAG: tyrosine-type recombinase/integrase [Verrucomicrobiota bacterium]